MAHYHSETNEDSSIVGKFLRSRKLIGLATMYLRFKGITPTDRKKKFWHVQQFKIEWDKTDPEIICYKIHYVKAYYDEKGTRVVIKHVHHATAEEMHAFKKDYKSRIRKPRIKMKF